MTPQLITEHLQSTAVPLNWYMPPPATTVFPSDENPHQHQKPSNVQNDALCNTIDDDGTVTMGGFPTHNIHTGPLNIDTHEYGIPTQMNITMNVINKMPFRINTTILHNNPTHANSPCP
jgi:hypothetical protein